MQKDTSKEESTTHGNLDLGNHTKSQRQNNLIKDWKTNDRCLIDSPLTFIRYNLSYSLILFLLLLGPKNGVTLKRIFCNSRTAFRVRFHLSTFLLVNCRSSLSKFPCSSKLCITKKQLHQPLYPITSVYPSNYCARPSTSTKMFGTIEQNLPQSFLKVLFWPLRQERGSKGAAPPF